MPGLIVPFGVLQDLFDSIAAGDYPEWKLMIQTMEVADEDKFDFDPLDDTKTWPEDIFPLQPVGRMVLNKNPDNFFNENEQVAYCPALIVPGVLLAFAAGVSVWTLFHFITAHCLLAAVDAMPAPSRACSAHQACSSLQSL